MVVEDGGGWRDYDMARDLNALTERCEKSVDKGRFIISRTRAVGVSLVVDILVLRREAAIKKYQE